MTAAATFPVRVRAARCKPPKKLKEDAYDLFLLEDETFTLRIAHVTKDLYVDVYATDVLRGMRAWTREEKAPTDAMSWAQRVGERHLRLTHLAFPTTVSLTRDFRARVGADGRVTVRNTHAGEVCRFNAAHVVFLAMELVEPDPDERVDDWFLRLDNAGMRSDEDEDDD